MYKLHSWFHLKILQHQKVAHSLNWLHVTTNSCAFPFSMLQSLIRLISSQKQSPSQKILLQNSQTEFVITYQIELEYCCSKIAFKDMLKSVLSCFDRTKDLIENFTFEPNPISYFKEAFKKSTELVFKTWHFLTKKVRCTGFYG